MASRPPSMTGPERLAAAIRAERKAQVATQKEVAERAGISSITVLSAEKGETRPRDFTLRALDSGLGWAAGTSAAILDGADPPPPGRPREREDTTPVHVAADAAINERLARIEAKLDALLALAAAGSRGPA